MIEFKPGHYLAYVLDEPSRNRLKHMFPPKFSQVKCDHITIEFNVTEEKLAAIQQHFKKINCFKVYGYTNDESLECLSAFVDSTAVYGEITRPDGKFYHITHSLNRDRKPVESNNLLVARHGVPDHTCATIVVTGELKLIKR